MSSKSTKWQRVHFWESGIVYQHFLSKLQTNHVVDKQAIGGINLISDWIKSFKHLIRLSPRN